MPLVPSGAGAYNKRIMSPSRRPAPGADPAGADAFLGRLKQLQTRYPHLLAGVHRRGLLIELAFFVEEAAIDASYYLLDRGITAIHRLDAPKYCVLQWPSLAAQGQPAQALAALDAYLRSLGPAP